MIIFFLFFFYSLQAEQIWLVNFPSKENHVFRIEKSFPLIDLLQSNSDQSSYIFLVPNNYLSSFARFIYQSNGFYRIIVDDTKSTWTRSPIRSKRWIPSENPLDKIYYGRFLTYLEQQEWYQLLQNSSVTRNLIRLHKIGQTYEDRSLTVIQIQSRQSRPPRRQRKLAVFIDGGMHAREWLSIGVANYILIQFLVLKEKHPKVQEILRYFDIFILPMMNPDGYEYSRKENRLWRKNRSPTSHSDFWNGDESCYGIDLNRNFPYQWNSTLGSSTHPCSHAYRGPNPASENEVQSVVHFLRKRKTSFPKFYAYFNLHAYGRFWLLPWTYSTEKKISNYDEIFERSDRIAKSVMNQTYKVGQASFLLYPCSGTSTDFAATLMSHSMTFELSPIYQGLPLCFEQNKTVDNSCTIGFLTDPEGIEIDGHEIFNAIVEYLYSVIQDHLIQ